MPEMIKYDNMMASQDAMSDEEIFAIQFIIICSQKNIPDIEEICGVAN